MKKFNMHEMGNLVFVFIGHKKIVICHQKNEKNHIPNYYLKSKHVWTYTITNTYTHSLYTYTYIHARARTHTRAHIF